MTDKIITNDIMIDGVNVSGCLHRCENNKCLAHTDFNGMSIYNCDSNAVKNCHYKQLKRKEQECEKSKEKLEQQKDYMVSYKSYIYEKEKQIKQQLDQYKQNYQAKAQECEELKIKLLQQNEINTFFNTPLEGWSNDPCGICECKHEYPKYKQALDKIEEYCKEMTIFTHIKEDILNIINKTKGKSF